MPCIDMHDYNIHETTSPVNKLLEKIKASAKNVLAPREEPSTGAVRQFQDFPLAKLNLISPFNVEVFPSSYYDDLEKVKIVDGDDDHDEGYTRLNVSFPWCLDVAHSVLRRHGESTLMIIGKLLMGAYLYSIDNINRSDSPVYTLYKRGSGGQLRVVTQDSFVAGRSRSTSPADRIDFTFLRLAVLVMSVLNMGYEVDERKIRTPEGDAIIDPDSPAGFSVVPASDVMLPLMEVHETQPADGWRSDFDQLMGSRVFASDKDYWNFCMGVFYSVMGLDGAHYFIMADTGGSGKTTLMNGLVSFAPTMATKSLQIENLAGRGFEHGMAVSQLEGKRIAIQDEVMSIKGSVMRVLNAVSSGATLEARYGGGMFQYVDVKLALWFAGNMDVDLPDIDAVRRRRVDIQLRNEMDKDEWSTAVAWDTEHRPAYRLVQSNDAFSHMFYKGMSLWTERDGEFFEIDRSKGNLIVDGPTMEAISSMSSILSTTAPSLADYLVANEVSEGLVIKAENMIGKPRELMSFLRRNGFEVKKSSFMDGRVKANAKWLVVDDEAAAKRIQHVIIAQHRLSEFRLDEKDIDQGRMSSIMSGAATIDDYVEMVDVEPVDDDPILGIRSNVGRLTETRTYVSPKPAGSRVSVASLMRDQRGIAPVAMWNAFARRVYDETCGTEHKPFVSDVPWSAVDAVDDGSRWASALGLRKMVDPETGEQFIGGMDAIDSNSSIGSVGMKFVADLRR